MHSRIKEGKIVCKIFAKYDVRLQTLMWCGMVELIVESMNPCFAGESHVVLAKNYRK